MNPAPNLVLVGPMGAGKSSIGRRLAIRLGLDFVDLDRRLEQDAGVPVATIFALEGEAGFRRRESALIADVLTGHGLLVSTGGGIVLDPVNRDLLHRRGFVVYLRLGVEEQLERLARDHTRPLLAGDNREATLRKLSTVRTPLYESLADRVFDSASLGVDGAVRRLAAQLQSGWTRQDVA
ncbi:shikimate kinase [soil metagenome]